MTESRVPPCGHTITHPSSCGPWLDYADEGYAEARAAVLRELREEVAGLPYWHHHPDNTGPDDMDRAAVLDAIDRRLAP
jgi:hypothetical protein